MTSPQHTDIATANNALDEIRRRLDLVSLPEGVSVHMNFTAKGPRETHSFGSLEEAATFVEMTRICEKIDSSLRRPKDLEGFLYFSIQRFDKRTFIEHPPVAVEQFRSDLIHAFERFPPKQNRYTTPETVREIVDACKNDPTAYEVRRYVEWLDHPLGELINRLHRIDSFGREWSGHFYAAYPEQFLPHAEAMKEADLV